MDIFLGSSLPPYTTPGIKPDLRRFLLEDFPSEFLSAADKLTCSLIYFSP
jgi:hypothetical protein